MPYDIALDGGCISIVGFRRAGTRGCESSRGFKQAGVGASLVEKR